MNSTQPGAFSDADITWLEEICQLLSGRFVDG